jgi:hypothetical protein
VLQQSFVFSLRLFDDSIHYARGKILKLIACL